MIYYLCCDKDKTLNLFMEKPKRGTSFWVGKERIVVAKNQCPIDIDWETNPIKVVVFFDMKPLNLSEDYVNYPLIRNAAEKVIGESVYSEEHGRLRTDARTIIAVYMRSMSLKVSEISKITKFGRCSIYNLIKRGQFYLEKDKEFTKQYNKFKEIMNYELQRKD